MPGSASAGPDANDEWSESCTSQTDGLIEDSFFYAFEESGPLRLEAGDSSSAPVEYRCGASAERERLTGRNSAHPSTMLPCWRSVCRSPATTGNPASCITSCSQNPAGMHVGVKGPVQLVVIAASLFKEIQRDKFVGQADVPVLPQSPARAVSSAA